MNRWIQNGIGLSAMGALCFCSWAFYQVGSAVKENRADIRTTLIAAKIGVPDLFAESRDVTIQLLEPCKPGKPETCGLIPGVRSVVENTGAATIAMQTEIEQTQPLIQNSALAVTAMSNHFNETADAATDATRQLQTDLVSLNIPIQASGPLLTSYTAAGDRLNEILRQKAIDRTISNFAGMSDSGNAILADGRKVTDKLTADFMAPQPWWKKVGRYASDTYDYGALFARHTP